MKKTVTAIFMAIVVCGLSLAFSIKVHAEDVIIEEGEERDVDEDETVKTNKGKVNINNGTIDNNYTTVDDNTGTVNVNYGAVNNNAHIVETNNNIIGSNMANGVVTTNNGQVITNNGTIKSNTKTVKTNNGTIKSNTKTVETNNGKIENNAEGGTINKNAEGGTIDANAGLIEENYGNVTSNTATIKNNYGGNVSGGTVENNYGGTVNNGAVTNNYGGKVNGGTTLNQWYEYIINGGKCTSVSDSKVVEEKNWIGKADSNDETLGSHYITVKADDGMIFDHAELEGGEIATGTLNADGSYTFGNITKAISIFFKQITGSTDNVGSSENSSDDIKAESDEGLIVREEVILLSEFTSGAALAKIPEAARRLGATYNLSGITTNKGFAAAINKICENVNIQNADSRRTEKITSVTIYSDRPMNINAEILETIENSGIDFIFIFIHEGKMYKVTIPRGAVIDFNGHVCEGPLYFGRIFGTTEEIG